MLICLNCGKLLNKKFQKKFCCWNCKVEYEARDKHLAPLSRLNYTAPPKDYVKPTKVNVFIPSKKGSLEERLNQIETDNAFWGRAKQRFTVSYNDELTPQTRKNLSELIEKFRAYRKSLKR